MTEIRKGSEIEVQVEKLAFGGSALGYLNGLVVFLDHGIPGQLVRARITRKKPQYVEASPVEVLRQSPHYRDPFCPHFSVCGGCRWQDIDYETQLLWKRSHVADCLERISGIEDTRTAPVIASPDQRFYRNKMEYTFSPRRWLSPLEIAAKDTVYDKSLALGLHIRGFYDKVFNVESCFLQSEASVELVRFVRKWCAESGIAAYSTRNHQGYWRFLVVREGKRTGESLAHLITAGIPEYAPRVDQLGREIASRFPWLTSFVHSVSSKKAQVAFGDSSRVLFGPGAITERLGNLRYSISAHSFFQTNPLAAEGLYETVLRFAEFTGKETVWDLYCGTGSISLFVAPRVRRVVGYEVIEEAISDAYDNGRRNGIENCTFKAGDLKDTLGKDVESLSPHEVPDVVITDPPRSGMHPKVLKTLLELAPERIVAVSCNPATLARDLCLLAEQYEIRKVQPFDLFPHTPHIECVVQLERR